MGADAVAMQKDHHVLDRPLLLPRLDDAIDALLTDAQHLA